MPGWNATGVVCKFLIWGVDVVCMVLLSGQPLTVTCAGLSMSLVLVVVFLVVCDRSKRKVATATATSTADGGSGTATAAAAGSLTERVKEHTVKSGEVDGV